MNTPPLMRAALVAALLLVPGAVRAGEPLDANSRDFDQTHLEVHVHPHIAAGTVDGRAVLSFTSLVDGLDHVRLHCLDTEVTAVTDGAGAAAEHALADGILNIKVPAMAKGAASSVSVTYRSTPRTGIYFHAPTKANPSIPLMMYSQGEGTDNRRWIPCYDEPDDRLTMDLFVTIDEPSHSSISNGTLVEQDTGTDGLRVDHWRMEQRMPTYLISLIVGEYEQQTVTAAGVPLEFNGPPGRGDEVLLGYENTGAMMAFFQDYTGAKYPYPRYAQTTVWDFVYGGMENSSATTMNMRLLHTPDAKPHYSPDGLVAHELAHQWFGDLMTCRTWDHLWLNEGFATYFTDLFHEHRDGADEFALRRQSQNDRYMDGTPKPETLGLKRDPRGDIPLELFGGKQYSRGAAILHQLRLELGDDVFRDGIRRYCRENADRAVTSEDFRRSMERAAGRDLRWFFDQWVYGAGYPVLKISASPSASKDAEFGATILVEQTQAAGGGQADAFRIAVPLRLVDAGGAVHDVMLDLHRRRQEFVVPLEFHARDGSGKVYRSQVPFVALDLRSRGGAFARFEVEQDRSRWEILLASAPLAASRLDAVAALERWPSYTHDALAQAATQGAKGDASWAVREAAVRALARLPAAQVLPHLVAAAGHDSDPRVRVAAAEVLGDGLRADVADALRAATEDPSPYVRAAAATSLGKVKDEGAYERLTALLAQDSHREIVRKGALEGLRHLGDPRGVAVARRFLPYDWPRGDHHGMREEALNLLLALAPDERETRAAVVALLDDPYHRMRQGAAKTCGEYGYREAIPALERLVKEDIFGSVKGAAKKALATLRTEQKKDEED